MTPNLSVSLPTMEDVMRAMKALHELGYDEMTVTPQSFSPSRVITAEEGTPLLPDQRKILILLIEQGKLSKAQYGKDFGDVAAINRKLTRILGVKPIDSYEDDQFYVLNPQAKEKIRKLLGLE